MILVTGASGFLGLHLVRRLSAEGCAVRALYHDHLPTGDDARLAGVEWMQADLLDIYDVAAAFNGIDTVYHCAAIVSYQPSQRQRMLHFNPESTAVVVNQALDTGIRKMVHVSSIAAIGKGNEQTMLTTEEEQWGETTYQSAYGLSKYLAETEVWRGIGEGLDALIINPGIIIGAGDWSKGSSELVKIAWDEFPFYTNGMTGWVDVEDVVTAMILLMQSAMSGERMILCEGNYSFREVLAQMAAAMNKKPATVYAGRLLTALIWRLGALKSLWGTHPAITKESAANAHSVTRYDNSKLLRLLPQFQYTPLAHTISRVCATYVQQLG